MSTKLSFLTTPALSIKRFWWGISYAGYLNFGDPNDTELKTNSRVSKGA